MRVITRSQVLRHAMVLLAWMMVLAVAAPATSASTSGRRRSRSAPVDWPTFGFDLARTGFNPNETALGPGTVGGLTLKWAASLSGPTVAQPLYAAGVIVGGRATNLLVIDDEVGYLTAVKASTGRRAWRTFVGSETTTDGCGGPYGVAGTAVIDRSTNRVYVPGGDDRVYALDLSTGSPVPGWPVTVSTNVKHEYLWSALMLSGNELYVPVASYCDVPPYYGRLVEIDAATAHVVARFWVTGKGSGVFGGGIWGMGGVSVDTGSGDVYTATGNALGADESFGYAEHVVRLSGNLVVKAANDPGVTGFDEDFGGTPMLYRPPSCPALLAVKNKDGELFVYKRGAIAKGPIQSIQMADVNDGGFQNLPAYDPVTNLVYVSNSTDSSAGTYLHGLVALSVQADCTLALAWQQTVGPTGVVPPPVVANGVVYYGDAGGHQLFALNATTGTPLWDSGATIGGGLHGAPMVVNGRLYVGSGDGKLYSFGL